MKQYGKSLPKDQDDLIELARQQDWNISKTASGHPRLVSPRGMIVIASGTPSDSNAVWDFRSRMKRAGLKPGVIKRVKAPLPEPKLVREKIVATEPEVIAVTTETPKKEKLNQAARGKLLGVLIDIYEKHDTPHGYSVTEAGKLVKERVPESGPQAAPAALNYYAKKGLFTSISFGRYRLTKLMNATQPLPAVATPEPAPARVEEGDAAILEHALTMLAKLEQVIKKHQAIAEALGKLGATK